DGDARRGSLLSVGALPSSDGVERPSPAGQDGGSEGSEGRSFPESGLAGASEGAAGRSSPESGVLGREAGARLPPGGGGAERACETSFAEAGRFSFALESSAAQSAESASGQPGTTWLRRGGWRSRVARMSAIGVSPGKARCPLVSS